MKPKTPLSLTSAAYPSVTPKLVGLGDTAGEGCHFNPIFTLHLHRIFSRLCQRFRHICQIPAAVPECEGRREMTVSGDVGLDCGHGHGPCVQMTSPCPRQQGAELRCYLARSRWFDAFLRLDFIVGYKLAAPVAAWELVPTLSMESCSPSPWLCFWGVPPHLPVMAEQQQVALEHLGCLGRAG